MDGRVTELEAAVEQMLEWIEEQDDPHLDWLHGRIRALRGKVRAELVRLASGREEAEAERDQAFGFLERFVTEDDEDVPALPELVRRCFEWGNGAWHTAGLELERAGVLQAENEKLREAAAPVVRKWREGKTCPDEIALLDVALPAAVPAPAESEERATDVKSEAHGNASPRPDARGGGASQSSAPVSAAVPVEEPEHERWLPAEPLPEPFGVLWGRLWAQRNRGGEPKWVALFTSWRDARAITKLARSARG